MNIGFVGDVSAPAGLHFPPPNWGDAHVDYLAVNLEGAPNSGKPAGSVDDENGLALYNDVGVLSELASAGVRVATLANNHIHDAGRPLPEVRSILRQAGIEPVGAGRDLAEAILPAVVEFNGGTALFLAFGWDAIECRGATPNRGGTAPLNRALILGQVKAARTQYPAAAIFLCLHWGFTLEKYPHPAHRELAHLAIDAGADAVIGHHPHCLQGAESHRGRPILYSLGNWFLPHGTYFGRKLAFPEFAADELAFLWRRSGDHLLAYHRYDPATQTVCATGRESFEKRTKLRELTPFEGMGLEEYNAWFARHRTNRSFLLPIMRSGEAAPITLMKERWIRVRHDLLGAVTAAGFARPARRLLGRAARNGQAG